MLHLACSTEDFPLTLAPFPHICLAWGAHAPGVHVRRPRRTHGPVGGAPTGAAEAAALPTLDRYSPLREREQQASDW